MEWDHDGPDETALDFRAGKAARVSRGILRSGRAPLGRRMIAISTVAILAPLGGDAAALARVVETSGFQARICASSEELAELLEAGPDSEPCLVLIAQEGADERAGRALAGAIERAPSWSRLPVVFVLADARRLPPASRIVDDEAGSAAPIVLERPVRPAILRRQLNALRQARQRQIETGELIEQQRQSEEHQRFLTSELQHRITNSLSVLQSLFSLTARHETELKGFLDSFSGRLKSFSEAHRALGSTPDETRDLCEIMQKHVLPHCMRIEQFHYNGPKLRLRRDFAFQLALVVHELAINAAKYGALSCDAGKVTVSVSCVDGEGDGAGSFLVRWAETGGPPVEEPTRRGLGSALLHSLSQEGVEASPRYLRSGFQWELSIAADHAIVEDSLQSP